MKTEIILDTVRVLKWVQQRVKLPANGSMVGIGLERDGDLVAGVLYEGYNGHNIWMHVAGEPGRRWMTREFLRTCFSYPFEQLGCKRVSGYVELSNFDAIRFDEHVGFQREAVLTGAASDGGDVGLYVMWRDQCRFLRGRNVKISQE